MSGLPEQKTAAQWQQLKCEHIGPSGLWPDDLIHAQLTAFPNWTYRPAAESKDGLGTLVRHCTFTNFGVVEPVIASLMVLAREQDHHPEVCFGYKTVSAAFSTHSAGGISNNDWICVAMFEAAIAPYTA